MNVKINGKKFNFDSEEIYAGEKPFFEMGTTGTIVLISASLLFCILWYFGGFHIAEPLIRFIFPNVSNWVRW